MSALRDLQRDFLSGLTGTDTARALIALRDSGAVSVARRYGVYRGNVQENSRQALATGFAVTAALGGESWFAGVVSRYLVAHAPTSGDLSSLGAKLPGFLATELGSTPHAYISEVARLERAYQESMLAQDATALDAVALAGVAADDHPRLVLRLHPGLRLVDARAPVLRIWQAHQADGPDPASVDPYAGKQFVATLRRAEFVELASLPAATGAILLAFARGAPLGIAADEALAADPDADLGAALQQVFAAGYVTGFYLSPA